MNNHTKPKQHVTSTPTPSSELSTTNDCHPTEPGHDYCASKDDSFKLSKERQDFYDMLQKAEEAGEMTHEQRYHLLKAMEKREVMQGLGDRTLQEERLRELLIRDEQEADQQFISHHDNQQFISHHDKGELDHPFINRVKYALGKKCQSTIWNDTDKVVYAIVTDRNIGTTNTNARAININPTIGGNSLGCAGGTHTNQNNMGPTPASLRPIQPHKNRTFNLESSDYYLSYYTKDIASRRIVFHEVNVKVKGKYDYKILPEYLEEEVE